jgi:hypothetical protein
MKIQIKTKDKKDKNSFLCSYGTVLMVVVGGYLG